jgi:uncharacterized protein (TIGR03792 family)
MIVVIGLVLPHPADADALSDQTADMVIEWLKIKVDPDYRERYIATDDQVWTPALRQYPGFIDKTTWLNPDDASEVVLVIRWASREQWKAIPTAELDMITQRFDAAFPFPYEMIEEKEYIPQES